MATKKKTGETQVDPFEDMFHDPGLYDLAPDPHQDFLDRTATKDGRKLAINWRILESEYIFGFLKENKKTKEIKRVYPTMSDLSRRHRVSTGSVSRYAQKGNWCERRVLFVAQLRREIDQEIAKSRAISLGDLSGSVDRYLAGFMLAIQNNAVENSKMSDFEKATRLKVWLDKEAQEIAGAQTNGVPLDELQRVHAKLDEQAKGLSDAVTGQMEGRADREAKQDATRTGVSVLSEQRTKRDTKAAKAALASLKRTHLTGWDVCDTLSA